MGFLLHQDPEPRFLGCYSGQLYMVQHYFYRPPVKLQPTPCTRLPAQCRLPYRETLYQSQCMYAKQHGVKAPCIVASRVTRVPQYQPQDRVDEVTVNDFMKLGKEKPTFTLQQRLDWKASLHCIQTELQKAELPPSMVPHNLVGSLHQWLLVLGNSVTPLQTACRQYFGFLHDQWAALKEMAHEFIATDSVARYIQSTFTTTKLFHTQMNVSLFVMRAFFRLRVVIMTIPKLFNEDRLEHYFNGLSSNFESSKVRKPRDGVLHTYECCTTCRSSANALRQQQSETGNSAKKHVKQKGKGKGKKGGGGKRKRPKKKAAAIIEEHEDEDTFSCTFLESEMRKWPWLRHALKQDKTWLAASALYVSTKKTCRTCRLFLDQPQQAFTNLMVDFGLFFKHCICAIEMFQDIITIAPYIKCCGMLLTPYSASFMHAHLLELAEIAASFENRALWDAVMEFGQVFWQGAAVALQLKRSLYAMLKCMKHQVSVDMFTMLLHDATSSQATYVDAVKQEIDEGKGIYAKRLDFSKFPKAFSILQQHLHFVFWGTLYLELPLTKGYSFKSAVACDADTNKTAIMLQSAGLVNDKKQMRIDLVDVPALIREWQHALQLPIGIATPWIVPSVAVSNFIYNSTSVIREHESAVRARLAMNKAANRNRNPASYRDSAVNSLEKALAYTCDRIGIDAQMSLHLLRIAFMETFLDGTFKETQRTEFRRSIDALTQRDVMIQALQGWEPEEEESLPTMRVTAVRYKRQTLEELFENHVETEIKPIIQCLEDITISAVKEDLLLNVRRFKPLFGYKYSEKELNKAVDELIAARTAK